ncbi:ADP-ribosylglycohydrolase family protein [Lewinella sp. W8]|uniref:ADP-ribosylglycohydrolase family protein n=1 Tax=Lewinella sp. W8 TaxID=2528208 RepID=UPI001067D7C0|nr:ADP-ribosylglycohydrolase family protein [Lewinella sp. W8]MTB52289.1 ADP-ribosylglycohydrolase family protein [Lewinella sp. W8]
MRRLSFQHFFFPLMVLLGGCESGEEEARRPSQNSASVSSAYSEADYQDFRLVDSVLYDKILGSLVGSAIGDAMGAPTEMWDRQAISEEYGHVDSLDLVLRIPSPEGPWDFNLPPGAGTDDTRWKALMTRYFLREHEARSRIRPLEPAASRFAEYLNDQYARRVDALRATDGLEPEPFEDGMLRLTWLQEWARVSRAYASKDIDAYRDAISRFYGGEMACAGMLYAPVVGAVYPGRPEAAYRAAYDLAIFDLGYARDITALTAAMTAACFAPEADVDSLRKVIQEVDPAGFFRSRLLGRVAYQQFRQARTIARTARRLTHEDLKEMTFRIPDAYPYDSLTYAQTLEAYKWLDRAKQDAPFHAGEIHLIHLTAMIFCDLDFSRALEFVTNYGRDNDTVAAVTGAQLGALHGYASLPKDQRELVLRVNREILDIDLEKLAGELTRAVLDRRGEATK